MGTEKRQEKHLEGHTKGLGAATSPPLYVILVTLPALRTTLCRD